MLDWIHHYLIFPLRADIQLLFVCKGACRFERCLVLFNNSGGFCWRTTCGHSWETGAMRAHGKAAGKRLTYEPVSDLSHVQKLWVCLHMPRSITVVILCRSEIPFCTLVYNCQTTGNCRSWQQMRADDKYRHEETHLCTTNSEQNMSDFIGPSGLKM